MRPSALAAPAMAQQAPLRLADLQAQAQADAQRLFGEGPAPLWDAREPRRDERLRRPWRHAARMVVAVAAVLGGVAATVLSGEAPWHRSDAPEPLPAAQTAPDRLQDEVARPGDVRAMPQASTGVPALVVDRQGGQWRIDAVNASRLEAAEQLARLSGVALPPSASLLNGSPPLDMHWRGHDLVQAWQAVIGTELNFALHCRLQRCRLWILDRDRVATVPATMPATPATSSGQAPASPRADDGAVEEAAPVAPAPVDELHHG